MNIEKIYEGKKLTMKVDGQIDTVVAPDFENAIFDEMGKFDSLILDFEKLEYISSAGLRVLIVIQKKLQPQEIPFVIKNSTDQIKSILKVSGLDNFLNIQ